MSKAHYSICSQMSGKILSIGRQVPKIWYHFFYYLNVIIKADHSCFLSSCILSYYQLQWRDSHLQDDLQPSGKIVELYLPDKNQALVSQFKIIRYSITMWEFGWLIIDLLYLFIHLCLTNCLVNKSAYCWHLPYFLIIKYLPMYLRLFWLNLNINLCIYLEILHKVTKFHFGGQHKKNENEK